MIRNFLLLSFLIAFSYNANALDFYGSFTQGGMIKGKTDPKSRLFVNGKNVKISKEGYFVFGIPRDASQILKVKIQFEDKIQEFKKTVLKRKFKIQKIDGLPKRKVTPNAEDMIKIRSEGKLISLAKNKNSNLTDFFSEFKRPIEGITTGVYGSQRVLNGKPRRPHFGIDIAAPKGTVIKNSNNGKVLLAEKNLFFTGGTIIIDHGHSVITIYSHLDKIFVKKGEFVKRGEKIGTVGSTGRSTGPHLDFRIYCNNVPVDPDLILISY
jgi:murein DD-endopeptidase MepM/ murein hydrolase activator NlpD